MKIVKLAVSLILTLLVTAWLFADDFSKPLHKRDLSPVVEKLDVIPKSDVRSSCDWRWYFNSSGSGIVWKVPDPTYNTQTYAMRFTSECPETLIGVNVYVYNSEDGTFGNDDIIITVYTDDGEGFPDIPLATGVVPAGTYPQFPAPTYVDFSSYGLVMLGHFHVGFSSSGAAGIDYERCISDDGTDGLNRSSAYEAGAWYSMQSLWGIDCNFLFDIFICYEDSDGDGVGDDCDNCPTVSNADQADYDDEGIGDACDNCPFYWNPSQYDSNFDGIGDTCTFDQSTPSGNDVSIALGNDIIMTFENISTGGTTNLTETATGPDPDSLEIIPVSLPKYYNMTTTTTFDGLIEICITYDDTGIDGENENFLSLLHYDGYEWINMTTSLDIVSNNICGTSSSLFMAMRQDDPESEATIIIAEACLVCGDADNRDGRVTILDAVLLINYKYKGDAPPYNYNCSDVNNDDLVNILDIVYIINFLYKDGPALICQ